MKQHGKFSTAAIHSFRFSPAVDSARIPQLKIDARSDLETFPGEQERLWQSRNPALLVLVATALKKKTATSTANFELNKNEDTPPCARESSRAPLFSYGRDAALFCITQLTR
jgi:hypothetical protein